MSAMWEPIAVNAPDDGEVVRTAIIDTRGLRNDAPLKRTGNLWFLPDGSMYVYYTPTHWMPLEPPK